MCVLNEWPHHRDREVRTRGIADLVCDLTCTWKVDREGSLIPESVSRRQFLGYDAHELMEQQSWVPLLHPDDRTVVEDALAQVYANQDATLEIRVRSASGAWHWLRVFARPDWSPALQRVVRLHGGFQDITTYKRREIEKTALLEVARDIAGMLDLEAMLSRVHRRVAQVLPCDVVATFRWEESSNAFRAVAEHGVPAELRQDMMQLRMARGTFGGRTRRGQPVVINDVTEQSWLSPELCARFRIAALIADIYRPPTESQIVRESSSIEVVNATGLRGMDRVAADRLSWEGFNPSIGPAAPRYQNYTVIYDYTGQAKGSSLARLQSILRVGDDSVIVQPDPQREVDFRVILGGSYYSCTHAVAPPQPPTEEAADDEAS